jgi:hypothetical protein
MHFHFIRNVPSCLREFNYIQQHEVEMKLLYKKLVLFFLFAHIAFILMGLRLVDWHCALPKATLDSLLADRNPQQFNSSSVYWAPM